MIFSKQLGIINHPYIFPGSKKINEMLMRWSKWNNVTIIQSFAI